MSSEGRVKDEMEWKTPERPSHCANGCGFFGSPETLNLCSKCYRDFCLHQLQPFTTMVASMQPPQKQLQELSVTSSSSGGPVEVNSIVGSAVESTPVVKNKCTSCPKKIGLLGFNCRCGGCFCSKHRYPEMHNCTFDYKTVGQEAIAKANPSLTSEKIEKL